MNPKYKPKNLFIEGYDYRVWSKNEKEWADKEESTDMEESTDKRNQLIKRNLYIYLKEGKGLKILTPNNLLTIYFQYY